MKYFRISILLLLMTLPGLLLSQGLPSPVQSTDSDVMVPVRSRNENGSGKPDGYNCWDRSDDFKADSAFSDISLNDFSEEFDVIVDLADCRFGNRRPEAVFLTSGTADGKAVLKLVLDPQKTEFRKARIELLFGEKVEGHLVNIGDSATNNGFGGDGATQSRDSEAQIVNGDFMVFGDDLAPPGNEKILASAKGFGQPGSTVIFELSNNYLSWETSDGITGSVTSPYLFSLDGQKDKEGPANYDIFIGLNQVVDGAYRSGKGITRARIKLFH